MALQLHELGDGRRDDSEVERTDAQSRHLRLSQSASRLYRRRDDGFCGRYGCLGRRVAACGHRPEFLLSSPLRSLASGQVSCVLFPGEPSKGLLFSCGAAPVPHGRRLRAKKRRCVYRTAAFSLSLADAEDTPFGIIKPALCFCPRLFVSLSAETDMKRLELLAPARDYASAVAAVDAGADAIYIGGARFGARHAAANSVDDIRRAASMRIFTACGCTPRSIRCFTTTNSRPPNGRPANSSRRVSTRSSCRTWRCGACRCPSSCTPRRRRRSARLLRGRFWRNAGFARVILERALSLDEIRAICRATTAEVECFVHGAICVGYSGQCYLSRSMSARSGNRGRMQPAVPSELRSGRRRRKADSARQAPALGARSQSGRSAGGVDRRGRHLVQDRRTAQRRRLYPQRGGLLPPPARRGDRFARRLPPCVGGGDAARFHPRSGEEFHARRIGVFPYGAVGGCRVVRHARRWASS